MISYKSLCKPDCDNCGLDDIDILWVDARGSPCHS